MLSKREKNENCLCKGCLLVLLFKKTYRLSGEKQKKKKNENENEKQKE